MAYYTQSTNMLNLLNDAGSAWMSGTVGSGGALQNSQCAIALGSATAVPNANSLTLNLAMTFAPTYAGAKNVYMYAANAAGINSGWIRLGTWTVP